MRRYWLMAAAIAMLFVTAFVVTAVSGWELEDPLAVITGAGPVAALISVGLLVVDVVAPIPASLIMIANGAVFGAVVGAMVSSIGSLGAFFVGFLLGRSGSGLAVRMLDGDTDQRVHRMFARRGALAVAVTRPVPIIAETTAVLAGASRMQWPKATGAAALGVVPQALVYALVGAMWTTFPAEALAFLAVLFVAVAVWGTVPAGLRMYQRRRLRSIGRRGQPRKALGR